MSDSKEHEIKRPRIEDSGSVQDNEPHIDDEINSLTHKIMSYSPNYGLTIEDILNNRYVNLVSEETFETLFMKLVSYPRKIQTIIDTFDENPVIYRAWINVVDDILLYAIYNSNLKLAEIALENTAIPTNKLVFEREKRFITDDDTEEDQENSISVFQVACKIGFLRMIQLLVRFFPILLKDSDSVIEAISNGNIELLNYFKDNGFDFNFIVYDDTKFAQYAVVEFIMDTHPHPTERSLRWFYDNAYITDEWLAERSEPPSNAFCLHSFGFDMKYMRSSLIDRAIFIDIKEFGLNQDIGDYKIEHPENELD